MRSYLLAALFGATILNCAPAAAETLRDALTLAYQTNPTIRAERARLKATRETKAQAWANALPQISASGSYSNIDSTQTSTFTGTSQTIDTKLDTLTAGVNAEQVVFAGFRNYNAIKQAGARVRAGGAQLIATEQQVLNDVAAAYFNVQRNMAIFQLNERNIKVLERQLEMAQTRFDVGEITRTDVAQAEARLSNARAELSRAQSNLAIARADYAQLVGQSPTDLEPVETLPETPENLDAALNFAQTYAPSVIAAREQMEVSRRQVSIARGSLAPSVSLTAGYQYAEEPSTFIDTDEQFAFGARATIPLFSGGANYSRIREAKALYARDRSRALEAERRAQALTTAAWQRLSAAQAIIVSAQASVDANKLALDGVTQEALVGTRTTLDVLDAEQELLVAEVQLVNAQRDAQAASFALLAAIGLLTPEAIGIAADAGGDDSLSLYD